MRAVLLLLVALCALVRPVLCVRVGLPSIPHIPLRPALHSELHSVVRPVLTTVLLAMLRARLCSGYPALLPAVRSVMPPTVRSVVPAMQ